MFSLQSQITMSRRHSQNCDETPTVDSHNTPNANKGTGSHVPHKHFNCSVRSIPSLPRTTIPSLTQLYQRAQLQIPRANNWLRNQLTYLGLVPRAYVAAFVVLPVAASKGPSFARTDAHSRLQLALWVGQRAASRCLRLQGRLLYTECARALVSR